MDSCRHYRTTKGENNAFVIIEHIVINIISMMLADIDNIIIIINTPEIES